MAIATGIRIWVPAAICGALFLIACRETHAQSADSVWNDLFPARHSVLVGDPQQLTAGIDARLRRERWSPRVNEERTRGPAAAVYPLAAPAVVVVRTRYGHGTGFCIGSTGWIITNEHVVQHADIERATHAQVVTVYRGALVDGWMKLDEQGLMARVHKTSTAQDLALLKLVEPPPADAPLPAFRLASDAGTPGADCVAIGHPAAGQLWTVRSGEVANVGIWPSEMIDVVMARLALPLDQRGELEQLVADAPRRRVVISTCGLNPGDSGGPLVNAVGELIGVSFAIPSTAPEESISLDKFSYHVHVDELRTFLEGRPESAPVYVPSPWPPAVYGDLFDTDDNGVPDTWAFFLGDGSAPSGILIDVDEDTSRTVSQWDPRDPGLQENWDFEFALGLNPESAAAHAFYDTDSAEGPDLILTDLDGDGTADAGLRRQAGEWTVSPVENDALVDAAHFRDESLRELFLKFPVAAARGPDAPPSDQLPPEPGESTARSRQ